MSVDIKVINIRQLQSKIRQLQSRIADYQEELETLSLTPKQIDDVETAIISTRHEMSYAEAALEKALGS